MLTSNTRTGETTEEVLRSHPHSFIHNDSSQETLAATSNTFARIIVHNRETEQCPFCSPSSKHVLDCVFKCEIFSITSLKVNKVCNDSGVTNIIKQGWAIL